MGSVVSRWPPWVYPRACGGTKEAAHHMETALGLSPRVRGNRRIRVTCSLTHGSIPARAGEPSAGKPPRSRNTVYPRACGGTWTCFTRASAASGLSPRVRGNPGLHLLDKLALRSIPARAGEPPSSRRGTPVARVYPRACGGTPAEIVPPNVGQGLSPRVRGNLLRETQGSLATRSIPARAGEPAATLVQATLVGVYPRACGGTGPGRCPGGSLQGLSPRVRGNRGSGYFGSDVKRSIPARAGEP